MTNKSPFRYLYISLVILMLDQASKYTVWLFMPHSSISVIGDLFRLTHIQNYGALFGFSPGSEIFNKIFFTSIAVLVIGALAVMLTKYAQSRVEKICFSMLIGGALGNALDRVTIGSVTDFLDFDFPDWVPFIDDRWPIFNIADSAMVCSVTILLVYMIFFEHRYRQEDTTNENK